MTTPPRAPDITTGSPTMNGEHRLQVSLVAALRDAVAEGQSVGRIDEILDQLLEFTKAHFASEELLMRLYSYDGYDAHVREHEAAVERMESIRDRYRSGNHALTLESVDSLNHWILHHTQRTDRALGAYLMEIGGDG